MRCFSCKRGISKVLQAKMVADFDHDGTVETYGFMAPHGKLNEAKGTLLHAYHFKCYQVMRKREARGGDSLTGRLLGTDVPTAYDLSKLAPNKDDMAELGLSPEQAREATTSRFSDRAAQLRQEALRAGGAMEDVAERERRRAATYGGPYNHDHGTTVDRQRLESHLLWAHGFVAEERSYGVMGIKHGELHARMALEAKQRDRQAEPGHVDPDTQDWREQFVTDV